MPRDSQLHPDSIGWQPTLYRSFCTLQGKHIKRIVKKYAPALRIMVTLLVTIFPLLVMALDCELGHIQLSSQAEIDNFQAAHGPCDTVTSGLAIDGSADPSAIVDLSGLSGLQTIEGGLVINEASQLTSLEGLENIVYLASALILSHCSSLTNLNELSGISNEIFGLLLTNNYQLSDISGLSNVAGITGSLTITSNPSLTSLASLPTVIALSGAL